MNFDRFRAYTLATATNSAVVKDQSGQIPRDDDGNIIKEVVEEWPVEDVAFAGDATDGKAEFDAGDVTVTRVVFYAGDEANERVVGQVEVNASGVISVGAED